MVARRLSWLPVTGCVPCPVRTTAKPQWTGVNPFPGFVRADGGYFSYPLSTWYLPIPPLGEIPDSRTPSSDIPLILVGQVAFDQLAAFTAILSHESNGHGSLTRLHSKRLLRNIAASAYEVLFIMMAEDTDPEWWISLRGYNEQIGQVTNNFALVDEALATLVGIALLRDDNKFFHIPGTADAIEDESVAIQAKHFGLAFETTYSKMAALHGKVGGYPLKALVTYAQDPHHVDVSFLTDGQREVEAHYASPESGAARVNKALDLIRAAPYSSAEYRLWSQDDWHEFFSRWLLNFQPWIESRNAVEQTLAQAHDHAVEWWNKRGLNLFNPVFGSEFAAQRAQFAAYIITSPSTFITNRHDFLDQSGIEAVIRELTAKHEEAQSRGKVPLAVTQAPGTSAGLAFVPQVDEGGGTSPYVHLTLDADCEWLNAEDIPEFADQMRSIARWHRVNAVMARYGGLQALVFFEGVRTMVATGEGIQCPLRCKRSNKRIMANVEEHTGLNLVSDSECCGAQDWLINLWKAGKRAEKELGVEFKRWVLPLECLHDSVENEAV
jgi:hypothetical protein